MDQPQAFSLCMSPAGAGPQSAACIASDLRMSALNKMINPVRKQLKIALLSGLHITLKRALSHFS